MHSVHKITLRTKNLYTGYSTNQILQNNLNLHAYYGKLICLMGVNGSGKSTLLRTISGMQKSLGGYIYVNNHEISIRKPQLVAKQISVVLTDAIDDINLTVYDLVSLGRFPYSSWIGHISETDKKVINQTIHLFTLEELSHKFIFQLSDGERQRVMIAKAMVQDTPVILLDEPTAHLDIPNALQIMRLLKKMAMEKGKTIIFSSHQLSLALQFADYGWLLSKEKPCITGTFKCLFENGEIERAFGIDIKKNLSSA